MTCPRPVAAGLFAIAFLWCSGCEKKIGGQAPPPPSAPPVNEAGKAPAKDPTPKSEPAPTSTLPVVSLTSVEYAEEYKKDGVAAQAKYKDKMIELKGVITYIARGPFAEPFLLLEGRKGELGFHCLSVDRDPW
jgi:hypothetical protein